MTEKQKKAYKKWALKNKDRVYYLSKKSTTKSFILKYATMKDLRLCMKYIQERLIKNYEN